MNKANSTKNFLYGSAIIAIGALVIFKLPDLLITKTVPTQIAQSAKVQIDTYSYYPTVEVIHRGGRSPVIVYK